jgi:hypothetical protein
MGLRIRYKVWLASDVDNAAVPNFWNRWQHSDLLLLNRVVELSAMVCYCIVRKIAEYSKYILTICSTTSAFTIWMTWVIVKFRL